MRVLLLGYAFWLFALFIAWRTCFSSKRYANDGCRKQTLTFVALLILSVGIFFRPHEDIFGGQDGGAYLNTAARLARDPHLSYTDELLAAAPPEARPLFLYYGPGRPYLSKYACGRVIDLDGGVCGVWFQPAYPIAASIPGRFLGPRAVLYVIPFFALLLAFVLRTLFRELWPEHPATGDAAALLYVLNPLVVWHARHPRPEVIASFLLFSASVLLLRGWRRPDRPGAILDIATGACAMALAPFFHVTAWMVAAPAALVVTLATLLGRRIFLPYFIIAYAGFRIFVWQLQHITDTYGLLRSAPWLGKHFLLHHLAFLVALSTLFLFSHRASRWLEKLAPFRTAASSLTAVGVVLAYSVCWLLARLNPPTKEWPPVHYYMYRTDISAVMNFISRPVAALVIIGLLVMALARRKGHHARLVILWTAVPATLLIGNLYDFFVTRYLLVSFLPLASLALASLVLWANSAAPRHRGLVYTTALVCLAGLLVRGRTHLITTTEYRGLQQYVHSLARPILQENGILLFEYSRLAAPFDLTFGVPTLALHNERDDDYTLQENAWAHIMKRYADRRAYFITPFQKPRSDLFAFLPCGSTTYTGSLLVQKRWDLPTEVRPWNITLRIYRMELAGSGFVSEVSLPDIGELGPGNLGLRRFARVPQKPRTVSVFPLQPHSLISLCLPNDQPAFTDHHERIVLLVVTQQVDGLSVTLRTPHEVATHPARHLVNEWWYAAFRGTNVLLPNEPLLICADADTLLHDVLLVDSNRCVSLAAWAAPHELRRQQLTLQPLYTRWARQNASACIPVPNVPAMLLTFHTAPDELLQPLSVTAVSSFVPDSGPRIMPPGRWMWTAWYLVPADAVRWGWVSFLAEPPFDPQMPGYPPDLITHFGWICVVPR